MAPGVSPNPPLPYTIYIIVPCVTDKICNTLDMAPGVNPILQKWGYWLNLSKTAEMPTPKPYVFLFLVSRNI